MRYFFIFLISFSLVSTANEKVHYKRIYKSMRLIVSSDKRDESCQQFEKTIKDCYRQIKKIFGEISTEKLRYIHYNLTDEPANIGHVRITRSELSVRSSPELLRLLIKPILARFLKENYADFELDNAPWLTGLVVHRMMNPQEEVLTRQEKDFSCTGKLLLEKRSLPLSIFALDKEPPSSYWLQVIINEHCALLWETLRSKYQTTNLLRRALFDAASQEKPKKLLLSLCGQKDMKKLEKWFVHNALSVCFHPLNTYSSKRVKDLIAEAFVVNVSEEDDSGITQIAPKSLLDLEEVKMDSVTVADIIAIESKLISLSYRSPGNMHKSISLYLTTLEMYRKKDEKGFNKLLKVAKQEVENQIKRVEQISYWGRNLTTRKVDPLMIEHLHSIRWQSRAKNREFFVKWQELLLDIENKTRPDF